MKPSPSRRWSLLALALPLLFLSGCSTLQQLAQMATLTQCQFRLASVDQVSLSGIPLEEGMSLSDIEPLDLLKLRSAFTSKNLPLQFTVNVEAKNPNSSAAGMNRMEWILFIDGNRMTSGTLEKPVQIPGGGGTGSFPLIMNLNLLDTLSSKTFNSMVNLALNIAGEGTKPTHVTLQVKPSIMVGNQALDYPDYITVNRDFGGTRQAGN